MMQVDLVIVYNEIVINSKLQLEKPMSSALAMPGKAIFRKFSFNESDILVMPGRVVKVAKQKVSLGQ